MLHQSPTNMRRAGGAYILPSFGRGIFAGSAIFSLLRNHASRVRGCAIRPRAGRASKRRSTAIELFCAPRKQCARPAMRMTIGCIGDAVHRIVLRFWGCRIDFCFSANSGSISEAAPLCIRANGKNSFKHRLLTLARAVSLARRAA